MRLASLLSDTYWVFWREMKRFQKQKTRILLAVVQPLVWLILMGYTLDGLTRNPTGAAMLGTGNYLDFITPGIMIMTALFGGVGGGATVLWDRRLGFLNKMLAAPIHRAAIPLGKLMAMGLQTVFKVAVILGIALALGVHISTGFLGILFLLVLAGIFGTIMGGISLALASVIRSHETLSAMTNFLTMPLLLTSNAIFPSKAMPEWLQGIAMINPVSQAVVPMRTVVTQGWVWQDICPGTLAVVIMALISVALAIKQFYRSVA